MAINPGAARVSWGRGPRAQKRTPILWNASADLAGETTIGGLYFYAEGALALSAGADTSAAAGALAIAGASSLTAGADTVSGAGTVAAPTTTGSASLTTGAATLAAAGALAIAGAAALGAGAASLGGAGDVFSISRKRLARAPRERAIRVPGAPHGKIRG